MAANTKKTPLAELPATEQATDQAGKITEQATQIAEQVTERFTVQTKEFADQARDFADQARDYSEQFIASAKTWGNYALDAYEQAANTVLGVQTQVAQAVKTDWLPSIVPAAINANVRFVEDVHAAYVKAARATLS
jgi:1-deoxy-D-xylulose 5-phosphate reductoisomerase